MQESGLFSLDDPFANLSCPFQPDVSLSVKTRPAAAAVVTTSTPGTCCWQQQQQQQQQHDVDNEHVNDATFDPFASSETSMLFGDDYQLSYSYEILWNLLQRIRFPYNLNSYISFTIHFSTKKKKRTKIRPLSETCLATVLTVMLRALYSSLNPGTESLTKLFLKINKQKQNITIQIVNLILGSVHSSGNYFALLPHIVLDRGR